MIEFSDPLSSDIERIFFRGCFRKSFSSFWIIGRVNSREEEKKPWAKIKKVDKNCYDDDKFIRKIKEQDNHVGEEGIKDPPDHRQSGPYHQGVKKIHSSSPILSYPLIFLNRKRLASVLAALSGVG